MGTATRAEQLQALVAGSRRMLQLAESGDWDGVARFQELRQQLAEAFFAKPVDSGEVAAVESAIRQILADDRKITGLGRQQRDHLEQDMDAFRRRRHVARQYGDNQAP